jgi:hypothetical protein
MDQSDFDRPSLVAINERDKRWISQVFLLSVHLHQSAAALILLPRSIPASN